MKQKLNRARQLRKDLTEAEQKLWYHLRDRRLLGYKFKRQVPIGDYMVDFLCFEIKLIIEIDGGQHNDNEDIKYDYARSEYLKQLGYIVLRYWNDEIFLDIDSVLEEICFYMK